MVTARKLDLERVVPEEVFGGVVVAGEEREPMLAEIARPPGARAEIELVRERG